MLQAFPPFRLSFFDHFQSKKGGSGSLGPRGRPPEEPPPPRRVSHEAHLSCVLGPPIACRARSLRRAHTSGSEAQRETRAPRATPRALRVDMVKRGARPRLPRAEPAKAPRCLRPCYAVALAVDTSIATGLCCWCWWWGRRERATSQPLAMRRALPLVRPSGQH